MLARTTPQVILLDIEGTTTPIDFVYKTLFPFARRWLEDFLRRHSAERDVEADIEALQSQHRLDTKLNLPTPKWMDNSQDARLTSALAYANWLMDRDSKSAPLKSLQGKIWQEGYRSGELRGEVFPDVQPAFLRWSEHGKRICIFSSGSVLAQKLLFSTTTSGDLTRFITEYFDTAIGAKTEPESYKKIAASLRTPASEILFISDTLRELDAARQTGMETALCVRPRSSEETSTGHPIIHTFDEVFP